MSNSETLRFGFVRPENGTGSALVAASELFVDVPHDLFVLSHEVSGADAALQATKDLVDIHATENAVRLTITPSIIPIQSSFDRLKRSNQLGRVLTLLDAFDEVAHPDRKDPVINISTRDRVGRNNTNGLRVRLALPEGVADEYLSEVATQYMLDMARQVDYKPEQDTTELVKATVSRHSDIRLHANSKRFDHSLSSDVRVDPLSSERLLSGHGLHSNERKFICIAGAVAIAHAAELLS